MKSAGEGIINKEEVELRKRFPPAKTCSTSNRSPSDLFLLNEAREKLDDVIDIVHKTLGKQGRRPRTYRQIARKAYLSIVRNRKPGKKAIRKAIGKQLRYVRRNLDAVDRLLDFRPGTGMA